MRIIDIALKDLKQILRDRRSLLFLVAMPIVFTLFMGYAYRSNKPDPNADTRLVLAWVDQGQVGSAGQYLAARLEKSGAVRLERMQEAAAREAVRQGKAAGALLIPAGFSAGQLQSDSGQLTLIADPLSTSGQSLYQVLRAPVAQLSSAVEIGRLDVELIHNQKPLGIAEQTAEFEVAYQAALQKWDASDSAALVRTQAGVAQAQSEWYGSNPYNQASPGILVMFAIFGLTSSAQILVQERKNRTLERMLTTSLSPAQAMGGHFLAMFCLTLLQQMLLVVFGQAALGVNYLSAPLGILAVMVGLSLCMAGLGLLIGAAAKAEDQVTLFSLVAMFLFSALGGTWFPLETSGQAFAAIGRLTPSAWAMTGFQNVLIRGLDSSASLLPAVILLAYSAVFFALAAWRLSKAR